MANDKRARSVADKIAKKHELIKSECWPNISNADLWYRKERKGFSTIPRPLPLVMRIMDELTSGKPVSISYFVLWCRVFDSSLVEVKEKEDIAYESGFTGQKAVNTWQQRMKKLESLGFIKIAPSPTNSIQYVLIVNPYHAVRELFKAKKVSKEVYLKLKLRLQEVGAKDLEE